MLKNKIKIMEKEATNKRLAMTWKTVIEVSGRKLKSFPGITKGVKTVTTNENEILIINEELNIKKGLFSPDELTNAINHNNNNVKACVSLEARTF